MAIPPNIASDALYTTYSAPSPPSPSSSSFFGIFNRFSQWRANLGLPQPGTVENLQKEVKNTHLTNYFFDGGRADLTKSMSANPLFQVSHSFALGSQTASSSYNFGAIFATEKVFLQGGIDHDGNLSARFNQGWTPSSVSKMQIQVSQQHTHNLFHLEHDYQGSDFSINAKLLNPWPLGLSGIFVGSYLQSLTKNVALGAEIFYQRAPGATDLTASYLAKWTSSDKSVIATTQLQPSGLLQATYWQRLSERVEVAGDLQIIATGIRRDAIATLGAKYDLHLSTFRAQLDSTGKVSALLEQRFTPTFAFLVAGEIDHWKNSAKVGVGVMIESSSLTPEEMAAQMPHSLPSQ